MGIAPIDLQTMYANMNNVARIASNQQQGAQLAQQLQESSIVRQNAEKAKSVHKAADNEAKSGMVSDEGHHGQSYAQNKKNKNDDNEDEPQKKSSEVREPYLGQHINIER